MATMNFTSKEYGRRFRKALSVPFIFDQACSSPLQQFVKTYADSIGCNEKSVLFPLMSCCAACVGPNSYLELAPNWQEPLIIWTLVLTPMTLHRIDVAEHIKQQLLTVQNELSEVKDENPEMPITKFVVDDISIDNLQEILKINDGMAFGLYNNSRALHNVVTTSRDIEIMHKLHSGSAWFSNSKVSKKLLASTHFNVSILSNPSTVHHSLTTMPYFQELYHDCFLIVCAEENHVKFSQLNVPSQCENLQRIFKDIIKLHASNKIVYKLSEEASAKFSQIHDEITDKAKQLARKNSAKVFYPALSYLARLSCVLHILDTALEAINFTVPVDPLTWNPEISADTVWRARQVLGYVIEQKFVLSQPTMVEASPAATKRVESVTVVDGPVNRVANVRTNLFSSPQRSYVSPNRVSPVAQRSAYVSPQRSYQYMAQPQRGRSVNLPMRNATLHNNNATLQSNNSTLQSNNNTLQNNNNLLQSNNTTLHNNNTTRQNSNTTLHNNNTIRQNSNPTLQNNNTIRQNSNPTLQNNNTTRQNSNTTRQNSNTTRQNSNTTNDASFDLLFTNTNNRTTDEARNEPMISEVRSAGVPVPVDTAMTPVIESVSSLNNSNGKQSSFSVSVVGSSKNTQNSPVPSFTPQTVALMSEEEFLRTFRVQVRRLLMSNIKGMSLNHCVELEFAPKPPGISQTTEQKISMARIFLKRIETLGFGLMEGSNGSNTKHCKFQKHKFNVLTEKQSQLLSDLRINEREYEKCFRNEDLENSQNGVVCLE